MGFDGGRVFQVFQPFRPSLFPYNKPNFLGFLRESARCWNAWNGWNASGQFSSPHGPSIFRSLADGSRGGRRRGQVARGWRRWRSETAGRWHVAGADAAAVEG